MSTRSTIARRISSLEQRATARAPAEDIARADAIRQIFDALGCGFPSTPWASGIRFASSEDQIGDAAKRLADAALLPADRDALAMLPADALAVMGWTAEDALEVIGGLYNKV